MPGIYTADGKMATTVVSGNSYVGVYAADGSRNVVVDSTGSGLYHPSGAWRVSSKAGIGRDPSGALYTGNSSGIEDLIVKQASTLTGVNYSTTGLLNNSQVQITQANAPAGITFNLTPPASLQLFGVSGADLLVQGYIFDGYWIDIVGGLTAGNLPNTITIRNCILNYRNVPDGTNYAMRQDRTVQGPKLIIENCLFNGNQDTRQIQIYFQGNDYEIRNCRFIDTPFDTISLSGHGLVENNWIGPGGFRIVEHCDLMPVYASFGKITVQKNFFDHRNRRGYFDPSPNLWPLNNCIRITPNTQTDIQFPIYFDNNVLVSSSDNIYQQNGWITQDARSSTATPGVQFRNNWINPQYSGVVGSGTTWGPVFKSAGVITEPATTVHTGWKNMWSGAAISGTDAPEKNTAALLGYEPEVASILAAMTVQPDATRRGHINTLVAGLKTDGIWDLLSNLNIYAAHDSQAALVNWKAPVSTKIATVNNAPTFTLDRGYTTNGTTSYVDTLTAPNVIIRPDNITIGYWSRTAAVTAGSSGCSTSGNAFAIGLTSRFTGDLCRVRLGNTTPVTVANLDGSGLHLATRTDATNITIYRNSTSLGTVAHAINSNVYNQLTFTLGRQGASSFSFEGREYAAFVMGKGLTAGQVTNLYNRLQTYMTAVGA